MKYPLLPSAYDFDALSGVSDAAFRLWIALHYMTGKCPEGFQMNYVHLSTLMGRPELEVASIVLELEDKEHLHQDAAGAWKVKYAKPPKKKGLSVGAHEA